MFFFVALGFRIAFAQSNYTWNNVRIVAGGFVPGIVYHPGVQGLVYARTDIGDSIAARMGELIGHRYSIG